MPNTHDKKSNGTVSRQTTETLRLMVTGSFQVTEVLTIGNQSDFGDDSADDLDESRTEDISRDNETPSFSEDSRDIDEPSKANFPHVMATPIDQTQPLSTIPQVVAAPIDRTQPPSTIPQDVATPIDRTQPPSTIPQVVATPIDRTQPPSTIPQVVATPIDRTQPPSTIPQVMAARKDHPQSIYTIVLSSDSDGESDKQSVKRKRAGRWSCVDYPSCVHNSPRRQGLLHTQIEADENRRAPLLGGVENRRVALLGGFENRRDALLGGVENREDPLLGGVMVPRPILIPAPESSVNQSSSNTRTIDRKIEEALDAVKTHLTVAVHKEVDYLKTRVNTLEGRVNELETENQVLRFNYLLSKSKML